MRKRNHSCAHVGYMLVTCWLHVGYMSKTCHPNSARIPVKADKTALVFVVSLVGSLVCRSQHCLENMRFRGRFLTPFQQKLSQESCSERVPRTEENMWFRVPFLTPFRQKLSQESCSEHVPRTEENMRFRVPFRTPFQQKLSQESCSELGVDWSRFSTDFQQIFNSFSTVFQQFFDRNCYKNPVFNILLKKE